MKAHLRIGSRGSALARAQARQVADALAPVCGAVELVLIDTEGDNRPEDSRPNEGAFVAALEVALRDGQIDAAVHSAKDLPVDREMDRELVVAAFLQRADARDALVTRAGRASLTSLRSGDVIGTDSPRRSGFVLAHRPDLRIRPIGGNVDSRVRRLDGGEVGALVLAVAGLERLGLGHRVDQRIRPTIVPPAPGQGAVAVQVRRSDRDSAQLVDHLDDSSTRLAVEAERAVLAALGGGCQTPVGAYARVSGERLTIKAARVEPDGSRRLASERSGPVDDAAQLAFAVAADLTT